MVASTITQYEPEPPDPTTLTCTVCGATYPLNSARVRKALTTRRASDCESARLCWVCDRLRKSVEAEVAAEGKSLGGCEA